jgi:hypothetical protein
MTQEGKPLLRAVVADGNVKANRYNSAGSADPRENAAFEGTRFLSQPHKRVWELHQQGSLPMAATMDSGAGSSDAGVAAPLPSLSSDAASLLTPPGCCVASTGDTDADLEAEAHATQHCHPRLSCAREASRSSGISHVHGLVAFTCTHGQPLRGCTIAMCSPERMLFYDLPLSLLLKFYAIGVMYLDHGEQQQQRQQHARHRDRSSICGPSQAACTSATCGRGCPASRGHSASWSTGCTPRATAWTASSSTLGCSCRVRRAGQVGLPPLLTYLPLPGPATQALAGQLARTASSSGRS